MAIGYWPTDYWHDDYWNDDYWPETGSALLFVPSVFLTMSVLATAFVMPVLGSGAMAETATKNPQEVIDYTFDMGPNVPQGATISTGKVYASRKANTSPSIPDLSTALSAGASADAATIQLDNHPGVGAYLFVNPGGATEERLLVTAVSGSSAPFTATIDPILAYGHASGEPCTYEPGLSAQVLDSTTATVNGDILEWRAKRGVSGRVYRLFFLGNLDTGAILRGELNLNITED